MRKLELIDLPLLIDFRKEFIKEKLPNWELISIIDEQ